MREFLQRLERIAAERLVDRSFYLARYADVAQAGVDPVDHFAKHWRSSPMRAPSARIERWLFAFSPIFVLVSHALRLDRRDLMDALRYRINELATGHGRLQHAFCLAAVRFVVARPPVDPVRAEAIRDGLGVKLPIVRAEHDTRRWLQTTPVIAASSFHFNDPLILGYTRSQRRERQVKRPALWCATIADATIFGFSQVAAHGNFVVYEPEADPSFRYTSRQCEFVISCFPRRENAVLARVPAVPNTRLQEGILLVGRCGANYFHFLIEYMTKGFIIEHLRQLDGVPLIVPEELFSQEYEALATLFPNRDLVRRRHATRLDVGRLHCPSVMTFVPDAPTFEFWRAAAVNYKSLEWLRSRVYTALSIETNNFPKRRIYLARSAGRNITNAAEVQAIFEEFGFDAIDPAALTFREQVEIFASASHIAGPVGAAFANIVFAARTARVIGIVSPFALQFSLFASLAEFAGCSYWAFPGTRADYRPGMENFRKDIATTHGDYAVDCQLLRQSVRTLLT